ncbi:hypothetical protein TNCV_2140431 [Trichonephila clavipes]|uniref:RNase H type-1 domain-containing protein n=1 Tax=Trichonephila clavipes TaxID=2585209 RepID=A0A8X6V618_TRICX|nr:hypothetical protein TNCV_2140431 [Trichonephila clavipes]
MRLLYPSVYGHKLVAGIIVEDPPCVEGLMHLISVEAQSHPIVMVCRSFIQHLGVKRAVSILNTLKELSQQHEIYFQWIPFYIGLYDNEMADLLDKEGANEVPVSRNTLTFSQICSKIKISNWQSQKISPTHLRYWTDHQIGTSVHAPQCPMVMCIMMGTLVPGPHGLLCF